MAKTKEKAQISMDEKVIDNPELEKLLEERQEAKELATEFRKADKKVKDEIAKIEILEPIRIGRFVISKKSTEGRHVDFETMPGMRVSIKTKDEE